MDQEEKNTYSSGHGDAPLEGEAERSLGSGLFNWFKKLISQVQPLPLGLRFFYAVWYEVLLASRGLVWVSTIWDNESNAFSFSCVVACLVYFAWSGFRSFGVLGIQR